MAPSAPPAASRSVPGNRVSGLLKVLLSCLALLVAAQAFNGGLSLASLEKLYFKTLVSGFKVVGYDAALKIEGAVRFGKPLDNFLGLDKLLTDARDNLPELDDALVTGADGAVLKNLGAAPPPDAAATVAKALAPLAVSGLGGGGDGGGAREAIVTVGATRHYLVFPIATRDGALAGALVMSFAKDLVAARIADAVNANLWLLAITTGAAALVLLGGMRWFLGLARNPKTPRWRLLLLPVLTLIAAQAYYSVENTRIFRDNYVVAARANAERFTGQIAQDIGFLLGKGIKIDRLRNIEEPLYKVIRVIPEVADMEIRSAEGVLLYKADRSGKVAVDPAAANAAHTPDPYYDIRVPLTAPDGGAVLGTLATRLDARVIEEEVTQRVIDAATVLLISVFFIFELFVLLDIFIRKTFALPSVEEDADATVNTRALAEASARMVEAAKHLIARPVAFTFVFGWALPLSFLPLHMRSFEVSLFGLSEQMIQALPISAEMLCALLTALLAGRLSDRRGWHVPFTIGVVVTGVGAFASAVATDGLAFIATRGITGLGYGLAWMGLQGYIFRHCTPQTKAQGVSNMVAGILAGYICGTAIGGMLADRFGFVVVFAVSGLAAVLPLLLATSFMRRYMQAPLQDAAQAAARAAGGGMRNLKRLFSNRDYLAVIFLSIVPFSVSQVGLLYYTVPLYLTQIGVSQSNIGRVLMVYGISVVYLGPVISRFVDRSSRKKTFIVWGGLIGGAGLTALYFFGSFYAVVAAVFMLGLSSSLSESARSAFALSLPVTQEVGQTTAMAFQRAADKLGQMLGPLMVGAMFTTLGIVTGAAITGMLFLVATVLFVLIARETQPPAAAIAADGRAA